MRKTNLARLLARRPDGIFVASFEQGEIGPELFRAACRMGLEGLVSKRPVARWAKSDSRVAPGAPRAYPRADSPVKRKPRDRSRAPIQHLTKPSLATPADQHRLWLRTEDAISMSNRRPGW